MAENWTRLVLADGRMILDDNGRMVLVDSDSECCPVDITQDSNCPTVYCVLTNCLNVDVCGIKFCRCFGRKSQSDGPTTRLRFSLDDVTDTLFGRYVSHVTEGWFTSGQCGWARGGEGGFTVPPDSPRVNFWVWSGCNCNEIDPEMLIPAEWVTINFPESPFCHGWRLNTFEREGEPPEGGDSFSYEGEANWRVGVELLFKENGDKLQCRIIAYPVGGLGMCDVCFNLVLFEGEEDVPPGWLDACGKPTSAITFNNLLTCAMCGEDEELSPLGYDYGATGHATATCGGFPLGHYLIAGAGGTVVVGADDEDPLPSPCGHNGECVDESLPDDCDEGDPCVCADIESELPSSISIDASGLTIACSPTPFGCQTLSWDTSTTTANRQSGQCVYHGTLKTNVRCLIFPPDGYFDFVDNALVTVSFNEELCKWFMIIADSVQPIYQAQADNLMGPWTKTAGCADGEVVVS